MNSENFEHQMDFILKQQAVFSSEMIELKQSIAELTAVQKQQGANLDKLATIVGLVGQQVESVSRRVESVTEEMRDGFNNLIIANEATRDLANKIAALEVQNSKRMEKLERRVTDIEEKQE